LREVGADLGVQFVIEGSVQWARGVDVARVRITPRLVRVSDDTAVWTQQYDATLDDLFSVQADIGSQIIGALQVALGPRERRALALRPTADSEAYLAYLHGLAFLRQEWSDTANLEQALSAMDDAVSRDPQFAQAWSWLGRILAWQYRVGVSRSPETRARARHAAETALQLAAGSPDAHLALAELLIGDRDYDGARRHVELARVAQPNSAEPWRIVAFIDERTGRWREARTAF
jgi:Tfp pilus assembly protein PilF